MNNSSQTRNPEYALLSQCLLTRDLSYVLKHICGNLHQDLALKCRLPSFWFKKKNSGKNGYNVIITDYLSYDDFLFCKIVIQRNSLAVSE